MSIIGFVDYMHHVHVVYVTVAKDADEKEKWIFALENAISRRDFNHVCTIILIAILYTIVVYFSAATCFIFICNFTIKLVYVSA